MSVLVIVIDGRSPGTRSLEHTLTKRVELIARGFGTERRLNQPMARVVGESLLCRSKEVSRRVVLKGVRSLSRNACQLIAERRVDVGSALRADRLTRAVTDSVIQKALIRAGRAPIREP